MWYSYIMKKLGRKEIIALLQNKGNKTYKELATISGYHEKSLIRISRKLKREEYSLVHGNTKKNPHNKIEDDKKKELRDFYQRGNYSSKKEFYSFLCSMGYSYSYSFLCKIINKKKKIKKNTRKSKCFLVPRKTISENKIQYQNKRYFIKTDSIIRHHEKVFLSVDRRTLTPLYIKYQGKKYFLCYDQTIISKKGNTKY